MTKVITYGTYDLLHYGHIRLLERAKALGDYLIVGVTADDFDKARGKINVQQSLMERLEAVRATGIADEIIIEEYEGQKIDDIKRYDIDIFTVGSDWVGKFDYLNEYCKVVYLERTQGVSSSELREQRGLLKFGLIGDSTFLDKIYSETAYVNGIQVTAVCTNRKAEFSTDIDIVNDYEELLDKSDAVYIRSSPEKHYSHIRQALSRGKHVLCESPITLNAKELEELFRLAEDKKLILMEAIKTAYATAYSRLLLQLKAGKIGDVVSVDATCTSLKDSVVCRTDWNGTFEWAPTALLPVFQILGTNYKFCHMVSRFADSGTKNTFTKMDFVFDHAVASIKVGDGVKSEGDLIISGTKGYLYVPAPWWKTDYFEIRYEDQSNNRRYFYQLDGEGIRYELVAFVRAVERNSDRGSIDRCVTQAISRIMEAFVKRDGIVLI